MAIDPLAVVYTGDGGSQIGDGTGGAIKFGRSPEIDYAKIFNQKRNQATKQKYDDDVSAAQLAKAWSVDKPVLTKQYYDYVEEVKAYERLDPKKSTVEQMDKAWKGLQMKKAGLIMDINESADNQQHFMQTYNKVYSDDKLRYAKEDFGEIDAYPTTPLGKRKQMGITPASTVSAGDAIYDEVKGIGFTEVDDTFTNADGSSYQKKVKEIDPDKLRESIRGALNNLPQNKAYAIRKDAIEANPAILQKEKEQPGALEEMIIDGQMLNIIPRFGNVRLTKSKAAKQAEMGTNQATSTGIKNKKYAVDLIMRDGAPVVVANPMPGTKEDLKEVDWTGWNSEIIKGEFKEIIPKDKSKSGKAEIVLAQTYIDPFSLDKTPKVRSATIPATDNNLLKFSTIYTGGEFDYNKFIKEKTPTMTSKSVVTDRNKGGQAAGKGSAIKTDKWKKYKRK